MLPVLTAFKSLAPKHLTTQAESLAWLAEAHTRAEATQARAEGQALDQAAFRKAFTHRLTRFGCGEGQIATRGHELDDCAHTRWSDMEIYKLNEHARGEGMYARTLAFERVATDVLRRLYEDSTEPPSDIVHVTCTGYISPSPVQRLVEAKGWGRRTGVAHAYHMGCYAAFPALRMAAGFVALGGSAARRTDIVHTEVCSLHVNALLHTPDQLVVQSLFADGFIRYSILDSAEWAGVAPGLALLSQSEMIVPDTSAAMTWACSDWGMRMTLARDVPRRIAGELEPFVHSLANRAGLGSDELRKALYAVHPGGPKILDGVRDVLGLEERQIAHSREVLRTCGNMSSATLPHVWMRIVTAEEVPPEQPVVSLAFGPGLTVCGAILRKVGRA